MRSSIGRGGEKDLFTLEVLPILVLTCRGQSGFPRYEGAFLRIRGRILNRLRGRSSSIGRSRRDSPEVTAGRR